MQKNEETSTSGTQSFQGHKSDSTLEKATSITENLANQDVEKDRWCRIINVYIFNQITFKAIFDNYSWKKKLYNNPYEPFFKKF